MSPFTANELAFFEQQRLGRLASLTRDGSPTVTPVVFSLHEAGALSVGGFELGRSAKWANLQRDARFAFTVDAGIGATAKGVLIRGLAELINASEPRILLHAERIVSWGVDSPAYSRMTRTAFDEA